MAIAKLSKEQISAGLEQLSGWELKNEKLHRELKFKNFVQAMGFMVQAGIIAEQMDHHPEWFNVYSKVVIDLTTHEADGISKRDLELAQKMNEIVGRMTLS